MKLWLLLLLCRLIYLTRPSPVPGKGQENARFQSVMESWLLPTDHPEDLDAAKTRIDETAVELSLREDVDLEAKLHEGETIVIDNRTNSAALYTMSARYFCGDMQQAYTLKAIYRLREDDHVRMPKDVSTTQYYCEHRLTVSELSLVHHRIGRKDVSIDTVTERVNEEKKTSYVQIYREDSEVQHIPVHERPKYNLYSLRRYIRMEEPLRKMFGYLTNPMDSQRLHGRCDELHNTENSPFYRSPCPAAGSFSYGERSFYKKYKGHFENTNKGDSPIRPVDMAAMIQLLLPWKQYVCGHRQTSAPYHNSQEHIFSLNPDMRSFYAVEEARSRIFYERDIPSNGTTLRKLDRAEVLIKKIKSPVLDDHINEEDKELIRLNLIADCDVVENRSYREFEQRWLLYYFITWPFNWRVKCETMY